MNITYNNFIGIYDNVYPDGYCQHLIKEFDRLKDAGAGSNRWQSEKALETRKNDHQIGLGLKGHDVHPFEGKNVVDMFFDGLQVCYDQYCQKFSSLADGKVRATVMKMQRTDPGGGYHVWHGEQGNGDHANRVLVYMLYLNSLTPEEAGETEFLYQQQRFRPTENQMILWPAAFTHTHRGNTVFGEHSKYIVTGWFYYD
jgi:2OG-Fe(II) oxygenase superfamily